jgi:hypothetical protein
MAKKAAGKGRDASPKRPKLGLAGPADRADGSASHPYQKSSSLLDIRVVYCGDNLEQLAKLPDACVDLIYIDPPFNSNRNYEGPSRTCHRWGETKEKRSFEDRHESTRAYIDYLRLETNLTWSKANLVRSKVNQTRLKADPVRSRAFLARSEVNLVGSETDLVSSMSDPVNCSASFILVLFF